MLNPGEGTKDVVEHEEAKNAAIAVEKHENTDDNIAISENQCVICFNQFIVGDMVGWSEHCTHIFHEDCIHSWLMKHLECPICRRNFLNLPDRDDEKNSTHADTGESDIEMGITGEQGSNDERSRAISNNQLSGADFVAEFLDSAG